VAFRFDGGVGHRPKDKAQGVGSLSVKVRQDSKPGRDLWGRDVTEGDKRRGFEADAHEYRAKVCQPQEHISCETHQGLPTTEKKTGGGGV